jgi:Spy/CpxP family protein refolding chaperone
MKRRFIKIASFLIVLMIGAMTVAEAFGPFGGKASGPRMLTADDLQTPISRLELTDQQREQIKKLQEENYAQHQARREELQKLQFELRQMVLEKDPDQKVMQQKIDRVNELRKEIYEHKNANQKNCQSILTEEQLELLRSEREKAQGKRGRGGNSGQRKGRGCF